jgi:hypothetical protein
MADPFNPLTSINACSRFVVQLILDFDGTELATGTGFLRSRGGELFLVTAWHNLSGREPDTLIPKHSLGSLPNYVTIEGYYFKAHLPLYFDDNPNDEQCCCRRFWQHAQGPSIDVAVLQIPPSCGSGFPIHESFFNRNQNEKLNLWVTQSCIVVGFPQGLVDRSQPDHVLPIYKGAQIASEPHIPYNGRPIIVIDATTRPGMSGSPVFAQALTEHRQYLAGRFLGIYAGRFRDSAGKEDSALGFVFKPHVITEIFDKIPPFQGQCDKGFTPR